MYLPYRTPYLIVLAKSSYILRHHTFYPTLLPLIHTSYLIFFLHYRTLYPIPPPILSYFLSGRTPYLIVHPTTILPHRIFYPTVLPLLVLHTLWYFLCCCTSYLIVLPTLSYFLSYRTSYLIALPTCRISYVIVLPTTSYFLSYPLQSPHNLRDGVSSHQPHDCLLNRLFRHRSKKTSKVRVTGLCEGNSPVTGEFPAQRASNAEKVSIRWRHHDTSYLIVFLLVVV